MVAIKTKGFEPEFDLATNTIKKLRNSIDDFNLLDAMQICQSVKTLPYIPYFEVLTLNQIAEYLNVSEQRLKNVYIARKDFFAYDKSILKPSDIMSRVLCKVTELGMHYGVVLDFPNGVSATFAYARNTVFNGRGLLRFAIELANESETAYNIAKVFLDTLNGTSNIKPFLQWFQTNAEVPESKTKPKVSESKSVRVESQITIKQTSITERSVENVQPKSHRDYLKKPVAQMMLNGKEVSKYDSATDAAKLLGIDNSGISACCRGKMKTYKGFIWKYIT